VAGRARPALRAGGADQPAHHLAQALGAPAVAVQEANAHAHGAVVGHLGGDGHGGRPAGDGQLEDDLAAHLQVLAGDQQGAADADVQQLALAQLSGVRGAPLHGDHHRDARVAPLDGLGDLSVGRGQDELRLALLLLGEGNQGAGAHPQPGQGRPPPHHAPSQHHLVDQVRKVDLHHHLLVLFHGSGGGAEQAAMGEILLECFQELLGAAEPCLEYSHEKMKVSAFTKY